MAGPVLLAAWTQVLKGSVQHCPHIPAEREGRAHARAQCLFAQSFLMFIVTLTTSIFWQPQYNSFWLLENIKKETLMKKKKTDRKNRSLHFLEERLLLMYRLNLNF